MQTPWHPDPLGAGFTNRTLPLEADKIGSAHATLIRYTPEDDPDFALPDRLVPGFLGRGDLPEASVIVLPEAASPQQIATVRGLPGWPHGAQLRPETSPPAPVPESTAGSAPSVQRPHPDPVTSTHNRELYQAIAPYLQTPGDIVSLPALEPTPPKPTFSLLYIHGWNDCFFQTHLARVIAHLGGAFYALDLRRYGRSRDEDAMRYPGLSLEMTDYLQDIDAALNAREEPLETREEPLVIMAHSTGAIPARLWAERHPERVAGMILVSPWLVNDPAEFPLGRWTETLMGVLGRLTPLFTLPASQVNHYGRSLAGWHEPLDGPLPARLRPFATDPAVRGWWLSPRWKLIPTAPLRMGWFAAVFRAQRQIRQRAQATLSAPVRPGEVAAGGLPILALMPTPEPLDCYSDEVAVADARLEEASQRQKHPWSFAMRHCDTVLPTALTAEVLSEIFPTRLDLRLISGVHDLTLSEPVERLELWRQIGTWLRTCLQISAPHSSAR